MVNRKSETLVVLIVSLGAIVVSLPALKMGFLNDDFMHRSILAGPSESGDRLAQRGLMPQGSGHLGFALSHLFVAVHPDENLQPLRTYGALPWWTCDGFRVAFWRPVAAFTHWLDYRLFPQSCWMMHLHSILWFAVAVLGVAVLYGRIARIEPSGLAADSPHVRTAWIGALAALLYLLDGDGFFPTMWIANRNLLISLFFGAMTLIAHDRWRRESWRPGAVLAPACLLASLLATEGGTATFAYLFAYEVALGRGPARRRGLALVPAAVVIVLWRLVYNLLGYGASGGGFYADPVREPLDYLVAVVLRGPFFLGGQWTGAPADLYGYLPPASKWLLWLLLAALTVLISLVLIPMLRTNRRARFWLIGMYGAALPVCATVPMGRAMLFLAVGAFGVVAEYLVDWWTVDRWVPSRRWMWHVCRTLFVVFLLAHLPVALAGRILVPRATAKMQAKVAQTQDFGPNGILEGQDLVVVNAPNPISFLYDPFARALQGQPLPLGVRVLAPGFNSVDVTRTGERRLTVRAVSDSLLDCQRGKRMDFAFFYRYLGDVRSREHPLHAGDRISLPRVQVQVLQVDSRGFPVEAAFEFDVLLEDPSLKWLVWDWDDDCYRSWSIPAQGQVVRLQGPF
ncbi:MAG: hypothetical protein KBE65_18835 [Phycisphaerae bacterium]|nr:hypothetical protein [Phycisphaerae bacterium]